MMEEGSKPNIAIQLNPINRYIAEDQQTITSLLAPAQVKEKTYTENHDVIQPYIIIIYYFSIITSTRISIDH